MPDIDFLPLQYHQQHAQRQVKPWRIVLMAMFAALLAVAAIGQLRMRNQAVKDLLSLAGYYEDSVRQKDKLAAFKAQLQAVQSDAELFTYLRHPWPRTQLLAAIADPLPKEIDLYQIQIMAEQPADASLPGGPAKSGKPDDDKARKLAPAQRDLKRLREECDKTQTFVRLAGTTADSAALHRYLAVLGKSSLFAKAELRSIESLELPQGVLLRFHATVQVRAGYGQPGGPSGKTPAAKSSNDKPALQAFGASNRLVVPFPSGIPPQDGTTSVAGVSYFPESQP